KVQYGELALGESVTIVGCSWANTYSMIRGKCKQFGANILMLDSPQPRFPPTRTALASWASFESSQSIDALNIVTAGQCPHTQRIGGMSDTLNCPIIAECLNDCEGDAAARAPV